MTRQREIRGLHSSPQGARRATRFNVALPLIAIIGCEARRPPSARASIDAGAIAASPSLRAAGRAKPPTRADEGVTYDSEGSVVLTPEVEPRCMSLADVEHNLRNPPEGSGLRPPQGAITAPQLPNGCYAPAALRDPCCNPGVSVTRRGDECCYVFREGPCCAGAR